MSIESTQREYEQQLMQFPNVTGVGIGEKDGKTVLKVFVTRKVAASALQPQEIIPKTIGGYQTDVEELGMVMAQTPAGPALPPR